MIISPDTRRENRIPPGQSQTTKWPVLDAGGPPGGLTLENWRLEIAGLVKNPVTLRWEDFAKLPRVKVLADFHCVTRWSRLDNTWDGVSIRHLLEEVAGGVLPDGAFLVAHGYDSGWTTNLPLRDALSEDALVATHHDGEPLLLEHGWPARLMVPQLYAWKSAKWLRRLEVRAQDQAGFWERNGYHMHGDPWKEERFGW